MAELPPADEEHSDGRPIARLRRVAAALARFEHPHPSDSAWLIAGAGRYQAACRAGLSVNLDAALGLTHAGRNAWWTAELRGRRDTLLRELYGRHYRELTPGRAAAEILRLARQVQQSGLKSACGDSRFDLIAEALMTGQSMPGPKQLSRLLDIKPPL